ncbi:metalloendopeptidase [Vermiconidia calcicola]|uniref:Metalloendopeptidase n=1 Tax=Vermiconidia calcicola TaxID=1690605 RepID=A0ACC3MNS9_9PEZI|nr:metalloendopeptidase [Vermiconidia calcicola]
MEHVTPMAGIATLMGGFYLYHSQRVPVTNRLRFNVVSPHWEEQLGKVLFKQQLEEYGESLLSESSPEHTTVRRVLDRLILCTSLPGVDWDVRVVDTRERSAFVLPGGKVFVHRGVLDLCTCDDELAVILSHEIAHIIAHHSSESVSRRLIQIPLYLLSCLASGIKPDLVELAVDVAFWLPGSRAQEREADYMGLLFMAESGYDPTAALDLWTRWEQLDGDGLREPDFMRTHPRHHNRLRQISEWLFDARRGRLLGSRHSKLW